MFIRNERRVVETLIVGRTRKGASHACVGALDVASGESLRLLGAGGGDPTLDAPWQLGQRWLLDVSQTAARLPPFFEDVIVHRHKLVGDDPAPRHTIESLVVPWTCAPHELFGGSLVREGGKLFVAEGVMIPDRSTWFWRPSTPMTYGGDRFWGTSGDASVNVKYVGFETPRDLTPDDLVRLSLAYWWSGDYFTGKRCYLQLSGWF